MVLYLSPEAEAKIRDLVQTGQFEDESDVVIHAVDLLKQELVDEQLLDRLIDEAILDVEENGTIEYTPGHVHGMVRVANSHVKGCLRRGKR